MFCYTVYVEWKEGDTEEIDVKANSPEDAREKANRILDLNYQPGGVIYSIMLRPKNWCIF